MRGIKTLCLGLGAALTLWAAPAYAESGITTDTVLTPASTVIATPLVDAATSPVVVVPGTITDEHFIHRLVHANRAELSYSALALTHSNNPQVIDFARQMIADHGILGYQVDALLMGSNVGIDPGLNWHQQLVFDDLSDRWGASFDRRYLHQLMSDHRMLSVLLQNELANRTDPTCVAIANTALPSVHHHLAMADTLNVALGGHHDTTIEATVPNP